MTDWLERVVIAERAVWVCQFREGNDTIGQVIQAIFDRRGARQDVPPIAEQAVVVYASTGSEGVGKGGKGKGTRHQQQTAAEGASVAATTQLTHQVHARHCCYSLEGWKDIVPRLQQRKM